VFYIRAFALPQLWRGVQRKLKLIDAAGRLDDLAIPAGNRLELLKGGQAGRHSIRSGSACGGDSREPHPRAARQLR
jgi:RelE-like toxin of type II toxin-antitoxin system HigB